MARLRERGPVGLSRVEHHIEPGTNVEDVIAELIRQAHGGGDEPPRPDEAMRASRDRQVLRAEISRKIATVLVNSGLSTLEQIAILSSQAADLARRNQREPQEKP